MSARRRASFCLVRPAPRPHGDQSLEFIIVVVDSVTAAATLANGCEAAVHNGLNFMVLEMPRKATGARIGKYEVVNFRAIGSPQLLQQYLVGKLTSCLPSSKSTVSFGFSAQQTHE